MIIHANSSLPRSGSECFQALLGQNPEIYASATSGLLELFYGALSNSNLAEFRSQNPENIKRAVNGFLKWGAKGYYHELTDRTVIVDKSRGWLEYADLLWAASSDAKIISLYRDCKSIISSLEKIYRANPAHPDTQKLPKTVASRALHWMSPESFPLGLALQRFHDRLQRGQDERIKYINYKDLCNKTQETMDDAFAFFRCRRRKD